MTVSVDEFMKQTPAKSRGKPSPLRPFEDQIKTLRGRGYSLQQIVTFLQSNGIHSTVPTVSSFIRRHLEKDRPVKSRKRKAKAAA
ncbi:hypothetical protein PWP93_36440 [Paraburkholderia sp. A1RI-2L]|uniref:hypothetical protein n=1 Tax=Paraburkholderia sp. A1RI-2L TaxID=3028367 RepID=UPI003B7A44D0